MQPEGCLVNTVGSIFEIFSLKQCVVQIMNRDTRLEVDLCSCICNNK